MNPVTFIPSTCVYTQCKISQTSNFIFLLAGIRQPGPTIEYRTLYGPKCAFSRALEHFLGFRYSQITLKPKDLTWMIGSECWLVFVSGLTVSPGDDHSNKPIKAQNLFRVNSVVTLHSHYLECHTTLRRQRRPTNLVTPDGDIPVCNRFIPFNSDLIWRQSSAPDPWRRRRAWDLKQIRVKCDKVKREAYSLQCKWKEN